VRPPYLVRWDDDALESQRKVALDRFIEQRSKGADPEYARHFQACRGLVQSLFDTTRDLRDFNPEKMESAQLLNAARFLSVPPWSEDDLATVSGTDVTKRKTVPRAVLESAVRVLQVGWDRDRFPWISADREPSPQERDIAVRWTASIWAIERLRTERRLESSKEQQAAVESLLSKIGYSKDPAKEIKFNGVFRLSNGKLQAVIKDLTRPNGIAFSPDEKTLYIANSDEKRKVWMRYDVAANGSVSHGKVFADVTAEKEAGLPDGMKVDAQGNVYATGPAGVWVFSPEGKHLGTIKPPETPANCAWGDDGKSLYITAQTGLYRIKLAVAGEKLVY